MQYTHQVTVVLREQWLRPDMTEKMLIRALENKFKFFVTNSIKGCQYYYNSIITFSENSSHIVFIKKEFLHVNKLISFIDK